MSVISVPPDGKYNPKLKNNKNNNQTQRSQIRVLGNGNKRSSAGIKSNPEPKHPISKSVKTLQLSPTRSRSKHININSPMIASPTLENELEKSSKRKPEKTQEEPAGVGSPSDESIVGSLPRTLSTSVLRIKHRRTFWEKVVG